MDGTLACDELHGLVYHPWSMLQKATRVDYKRFRIGDRQGYWEYAKHEHAGADRRKPALGVVVGMVSAGIAGWYIRAFRQSKPPRQVSEKRQSAAT
jgi:hypothetical protein